MVMMMMMRRRVRMRMRAIFWGGWEGLIMEGPREVEVS